MANAAECMAVPGFLEETQITGAGCTSPVGLCTVAQLFGPLHGIGASGSLRASGTFVAGSGTASLEGSVCLP